MNRSALVGLALLIAAGSAHGYELLRVHNDPCARSEHNLFWRPHMVPVSVAPLPDDRYKNLAIEAWQTWNAHVGAFTFTFGGNEGACVQDGVASIAIAPTACENVPFEGALAVTRSVWHSDTGELIDADITFQPDTLVVGREDLFLQVAMHELGHVLGLAHSDACGGNGAGTLMKTFLNFNDPVLTAPQADDVAGANAIYGGSSGSSDSANSCAIAPPRRDAAGLAWLLPLALLLIGRRSARRN